MDRADESREGKRIGQIIGDLQSETMNLFRQEVALAKAEITEKAQSVRKNVTGIAAGAIALYTGVIFILSAIAFLIYTGFRNADVTVGNALWASFLIVGAIVAIVGGIMLSAGMRKMKSETAVPTKTMRSLKEDKEWITRKVA